MTNREPDDDVLPIIGDDARLREPADDANRAIVDGDAVRAVQSASRVIEMLEGTRGPTDEGVLAWRAFRARALIDAFRFAEAQIELRAVLAIRTSLSGAEARSTLRIRADLVEAQRRAGRPDEALVLARELLADRRRIHGEDDPQTRQIQRVVDELVALLEGPDDHR